MINYQLKPRQTLPSVAWQEARKKCRLQTGNDLP